MPSYLERYQQGEYVQVWKELATAGDAVRTEPLYSEAWAVAQETMRRAKHNIELLIKRLQGIGYKFEFPKDILQPASPDILAELETFEREVGPIPLSLRSWVTTIGSVNFMGSYPRLSYYHGNTNPLFAIRGDDGQIKTLDMDSMFRQVMGTDLLPPELSNILGDLKDMFQSQQGQRSGEQKAIAEEDKVESDPLVFDPTEISVEVYEEWQEYEDDPFFAILAPDIFHKANISGDGYGMVLPNAAADAPLFNTDWGDLTFVEYLRLSFEWAGFPGLQDYERRDEALLTSLKAGLSPL